MHGGSHFGNRLVQEIIHKKSFVVVGLDPQLQMMPSCLFQNGVQGKKEAFESASQAVWTFTKKIIQAIAPYAVAVKPQLAFYACLGWQGLRIFSKTIEYSQQMGLLVVADAKCNDIGSTATAYAQAFLGTSASSGEESGSPFDADAVTINPFLGYDGVEPFVQAARNQGKGLFVLVRTSNPSARTIQDLMTPNGSVSQVIGAQVHEWARTGKGERGYSFVGAVVGATCPEEAAGLRQIMPQSFFLVPGYGAQGGSTRDVLSCFNPDGLGALINASRSLLYAYQKSPWCEQYTDKEYAQAAAAATKEMRDVINVAVAEKWKLPWA
jgi:orotidine-5'-phosphate decarboxylase